MNRETPDEKPCSKCGEVKLLTEFKKQKLGKYGHRADCRACDATARRVRHAEDPQRERNRQRAAYAADPERNRQRTRDWRANNPEQAKAVSRAAEAKRRAAKADAPVGVVNELAARLVGSSCYLCGNLLPRDRGDGTLIELDHVIPLARGGAHCMDNLLPVHRDCNRRKNAYLLSELSWYSGPTDLGTSRMV